MFRKTILTLSFSCTLIVATLAHTHVQAQEQLRFSAGPPGGNWYALGRTLADIWTQAGIPTVSVTGGGVANVESIQNSKSDLGFSVTSLVGSAAKGKTPYTVPHDNVAILANLYRQYTYFVMRKDYADKHGVKTVADIANKKLPIRIATLKPGTSSEFIARSVFEKGMGVNWKDVESWGGSVSFVSYTDGARQLADNHLDAYAFSIGHEASVILKIESQLPIVILPVDKDIRDALTTCVSTCTFDIESDVYQSVTHPVPTIGDYTSIVVRKDLPENVVYKLTKTLWENKATLQRTIQDVRELNPTEAIPAIVEAHPGALKYWKEVQ